MSENRITLSNRRERCLLSPHRDRFFSRIKIRIDGDIHSIFQPEAGESRWCEANHGYPIIGVIQSDEERIVCSTSTYIYTSGYTVKHPFENPDQGRAQYAWGAFRLGDNRFYLLEPRRVFLGDNDYRWEPTDGYTRISSVGDENKKTWGLVDGRFVEPKLYVINHRLEEFRTPAWPIVAPIRSDFQRMPICMCYYGDSIILEPKLARYCPGDNVDHYNMAMVVAGICGIYPDPPYNLMARPGTELSVLTRRSRESLSSSFQGEFNQLIENPSDVIELINRGYNDFSFDQPTLKKQMALAVLENEPSHQIVAAMDFSLGLTATEVLENLWPTHSSLPMEFMLAVQNLHLFLANERYNSSYWKFFENYLKVLGGEMPGWGFIILPPSPEGNFYEEDISDRSLQIYNYNIRIEHIPIIAAWQKTANVTFVGAVAKARIGRDEPPLFTEHPFSSDVIRLRSEELDSSLNAMLPRCVQRDRALEEGRHSTSVRFVDHLVEMDMEFDILVPEMGLAGERIDLPIENGIWTGRVESVASEYTENAPGANTLVIQSSRYTGQRWMSKLWDAPGRIGYECMRKGAVLTTGWLPAVPYGCSHREVDHYSSNRVVGSATKPYRGILHRTMRSGILSKSANCLFMGIPRYITVSEETKRKVKLFNALSIEIHARTGLGFTACGVGISAGNDPTGMAHNNDVCYDCPTLMKVRRDRSLQLVHSLAGIPIRYLTESYGIERIVPNYDEGLVIETDRPILLPVFPDTRNGLFQQRQQEFMEAIRFFLKTGTRISGVYLSAAFTYCHGNLPRREFNSIWRQSATEEFPTWIRRSSEQYWWTKPDGFGEPTITQYQRYRNWIVRAVSYQNRPRISENLQRAVAKMAYNASRVMVAHEDPSFLRELPRSQNPEQDQINREERQALINWNTRGYSRTRGIHGTSEVDILQPRRLQSHSPLERSLMSRGRPSINLPIIGRYEEPLVKVLTIDTVGCQCRDSGEWAEILPSGNIKYTYAIAHPPARVVEQYKDNILQRYGTLYGYNTSSPLLGVSTQHYSLNEGTVRHATVVDFIIDPEGRSAQWSITTGNVEVVRNLSFSDVALERRSLGRVYASVFDAFDQMEQLIPESGCAYAGPLEAESHIRRWEFLHPLIEEKIANRQSGQGYTIYRNATLVEDSPIGRLSQRVRMGTPEDFMGMGAPRSNVVSRRRVSAPLRRCLDLFNLTGVRVSSLRWAEAYSKFKEHQARLRSWTSESLAHLSEAMTGIVLSSEGHIYVESENRIYRGRPLDESLVLSRVYISEYHDMSLEEEDFFA